MSGEGNIPPKPQILPENGSDANLNDGSDQSPTLFSAIKSGNASLVKLLLQEQGADSCATNSSGDTPLVCAIRSNNEAVTQVLLEHRAEIKGNGGELPGKYAMLEQLVRCLLDHGAAVSKHDQPTGSVLYNAAKIGDDEVVALLLDRKADLNVGREFPGVSFSPLFIAVSSGYENIAQILLNHGADPDTLSLLTALDKDQELAKLLLEHGADPNDETINDIPPLVYAIQSGCEDAVQLLLEYGAVIDPSFYQEESALFPAVRSGNEKIVQLLLNHGADPSASDRDECCALAIAQSMGNYKMMELLLKHGADPNGFAKRGRPVLNWAIDERQYEIVELLLSKGASPDSEENDLPYFSALDLAVQRTSPKFVQLLLKHGSNPNAYGMMYTKYPLVSAVRTGNLETVEILLKHITDRSADEALFFAVTTGNVEIVKALLDHGARLDVRNKKGETPLFNAARTGNEEVVQLLLERGAHVCRRRRDMETVLFSAARSGSDKVMKLLLSQCHGVKVGAVNFVNGETALFPAVEGGNETLVQLLLEKGANPNASNKNGDTALFNAAATGDANIVKLLLDKGVKIDARNQKGETALFHALNDKNEKEDADARAITVMEVLVSHGADINAKDKYGSSVLCHFLRHVKLLSTKPIKFMIDSGADMNARTAQGESTLHLALQRWNGRLSKMGSIQAERELVTLFATDTRYRLMKSRDNQGISALHIWAASPNSGINANEVQLLAATSIGQELIDNGAAVNAANDQLEAPLHVAATWTAAELLLSNKARPNQQDDHGRTPLLSWATSDVMFDNEAFSSWDAILNAGMDPLKADDQDDTLMEILLRKGKFKEAATLVRAVKEKQPGDINKPHTNGDTFLHITCKCESDEVPELIDQLLQAGANPNIKNADKETVLHVACKRVVQMCHSHSEEEAIASVHFWTATRLLKHGANTQSCLDIASGCPKLHTVLKEQVELMEIPALLLWSQQSEKHKKKLAQVTRGQKSEKKGNYQYHIDPIGSGSFGHVHVGVNTTDGREVAIKCIERLRMCNPEDEREVRNLVKLKDCKEIVSYLCCFEDEQRKHVYIVLELMEGNLEEYNGLATMDSSCSGALCKDVVTGLAFLHRNEILHRDIKPSNILYKTSPTLCLKIADFGLSTNDSALTCRTVMNTNAGTRCWVAPEILQATTRPEHSKESDVFACGLVLHFILSSKKHPFAPVDASGKSLLVVQNDTEHNIIYNTPSLDDTLSSESCHLVEQMIHRDKLERMAITQALSHAFFWPNKKKVEFVRAVGNQAEFETPHKFSSSPVTIDLEAKLGSGFKAAPWDKEIPQIFNEMTLARRGRTYRTSSAVDLVRFVRNCYAHVSDRGRSTPSKTALLDDFIFFDKFPTLLMEIYRAVVKNKWEQREEIKYFMNEE